MALVKCGECGKEISSYTGKCPHCGYYTDEGLRNKLDGKPKEQESVFKTTAQKAIVYAIIGGVLGLVCGFMMFDSKYPDLDRKFTIGLMAAFAASMAVVGYFSGPKKK